MENKFPAAVRRLDLESIKKINWQLSRQLCITASLMAVLISLTTAPLVVADENLVVPERTWQGIPGLERTAQARVFVSGLRVTQPGSLFALTPTIRPKAASQEAALRQAGFTKVDVPKVQLFPGEINRVSLYQKTVVAGERFQFRKLVLLMLADGVVVRQRDPFAPVVITNPGPGFQDDARPGAMIIGMDRTPRGRICGCSSINYWVICRGGSRVSMRC